MFKESFPIRINKQIKEQIVNFDCKLDGTHPMYLISSKRGSRDPLCQRETRKGFEAERPMDKKQPGLMAERTRASQRQWLSSV